MIPNDAAGTVMYQLVQAVNERRELVNTSRKAFPTKNGDKDDPDEADYDGFAMTEQAHVWVLTLIEACEELFELEEPSGSVSTWLWLEEKGEEDVYDQIPVDFPDIHGDDVPRWDMHKAMLGAKDLLDKLRWVLIERSLSYSVLPPGNATRRELDTNIEDHDTLQDVWNDLLSESMSSPMLTNNYQWRLSRLDGGSNIKAGVFRLPAGVPNGESYRIVFHFKWNLTESYPDVEFTGDDPSVSITDAQGAPIVENETIPTAQGSGDKNFDVSLNGEDLSELQLSWDDVPSTAPFTPSASVVDSPNGTLGQLNIMWPTDALDDDHEYYFDLEPNITWGV